MDKPKTPITIDHQKCKPCPELICIGVCPQGILEPAENMKPKLSEPELCTQCKVCANLCPEKAITVTDKPSE